MLPYLRQFRFEAPMRVAVFALVVVVGLGCKTLNKQAEKPPSRLRPTIVETPEDWDHYVYGKQIRSVFVFHEHSTVDGRDVTVHWVHDHRFRLLGFYTEYGNTYRLERSGEFAAIGNYTPELAMLTLTGGSRPIVISKMPPPVDPVEE